RPYIGIIGALLAFIGWFMQAGVFHLFAELLGGRGRAVGVLTVLAFADIPRVLVIPFQVISVILVDSLFGRFLTVAVSLLAFIWWAVLLVIGLREIQGFSTGRAVAALLIPMYGLVLAKAPANSAEPFEKSGGTRVFMRDVRITTKRKTTNPWNSGGSSVNLRNVTLGVNNTPYISSANPARPVRLSSLAPATFAGSKASWATTSGPTWLF
ncbi:MAG: YIP1 family protein, partial [Firmicutes bacterium]|nr:YIP1 family protein [Bacillota bacterium]